MDQAFGRRLNLSVGSEVINTAGDRGLFNNENNNASMYAALANTPNFFDLRQRADGTWPGNPYVDNNPLQTATLFQNRENVWRVIGTGKVSFDAVTTPRHTLRFITTGGVDFFNQHNKVFSRPSSSSSRPMACWALRWRPIASNLSYNINANVVYTFKTGGGTSATTQFGLQYETRELQSRSGAFHQPGRRPAAGHGRHHHRDRRRSPVREGLRVLRAGRVPDPGREAAVDGRPAGRPEQQQWRSEQAVLLSQDLGFVPVPQLLPGIVEELKLRAAFGQSGNQPLYRQKFTELVASNVAGVAAAQVQTTIANPNIKPERQREFEVGFDGTLFGGRANLEVTAYEKRITDLLLSRGLVPSLGFTTENLNGGVLRTRGLELGLNVLPVQTRAFQWSSRVNFFMAKGKMLELPVPRFGGGGGFGAGTVRIEQDSSVTQVIGNDSLADGTTLLTKIGEAVPDYTIQLSNDLTFKRVKLYFLWDRSHGGLMANLTQWLFDLQANSKDYDVPTADGRDLGLVRSLQFRKHSRVYMQDISFLKLREVTLSLELPQSLVRSITGSARYMRVSVSGRNLLTFSPYAGTDPEQRWRPDVTASARVFQELWAYPPSRSFWFSVDLGL